MGGDKLKQYKFKSFKVHITKGKIICKYLSTCEMKLNDFRFMLAEILCLNDETKKPSVHVWQKLLLV